MTNITIRKMFLVLTCSFLLSGLTACGHRTSGSDASKNDSESTIVESSAKICNKKIDGKYAVVPTLYQQDYKKVTFKGNNSVSEKGELIVDLCMIDGYLTDKTVNVQKWIKKHSKYIKSDGSVNINAIFKSRGESFKTKSAVDLEKVVNEIRENESVVLIEIPHKTALGGDTKYLIITGFTEDGMTAVRDCNKQNIEKFYKGFSVMGEPVYSTADVLTAIGTDSYMYIFRK